MNYDQPLPDGGITGNITSGLATEFPRDQSELTPEQIAKLEKAEPQE